MAEYKFVSKTSCETGEHDTGYALAPFGTVVLKQVNTDGTITQPVCVN
jgi:secreted PhoX family phosphatase